MTQKSLTYRGDVKAVAGAGGTILFTTARPENQPSALYHLDVEKLALTEDVLPAGGVDVVAEGKTAWVAGTDRRVYRVPISGGKAEALGADLIAPPVAIALLSDDRLGVLAASHLLILARKDGKALQAIELPEPGTSLAADPTGQWMAAGTNKGTICVFDCEAREDASAEGPTPGGASAGCGFVMSESAKLHEGAVTALLFETDELRLLSAGADGKLLSTHARGKLEPEDKGRGNNHSDVVTAMLWGPGDRLLTGSRDGTVKNWPRVGATKPATLKDGVAKVVDLTLVTLHNRTILVAACEDNTIRLFPTDAAGKLGDLTHKIGGALAWAEHELAGGDPKAREAALRTLAKWADTASVEMLSAQIGKDADHALRLLAAQLLSASASASAHARAATLLEKSLLHADETVRLAAFAGLRAQRGESDLRPLDLALAAEKADVGRAAIDALEKLAAKSDQALARLTRALDAKTFEVRVHALAALENVHGATSPDADILALGSKHADLRGMALVRLHRRQLLADARVQSALRRGGEDKDTGVRKIAFLVSLHTRPDLAAALRTRDPELDRQLTDLEAVGRDEKPGEKKSQDNKAEAKDPKGAAAEAPKLRASKKAAAPSAPALAEPDFDPLLQATASRALDTCLRGARGLAVLGDERALGLLLQLSREQEASARVEVARALAALGDPRGVGRLRSFLFDNDPAVRDAAYTALAKLGEADPLGAADAGLGAPHEDVRRRGLQAVIAAARGAPPQSADEPAWRLLIRALNDAAPAVRSEAFKAALNLQTGGGGVNTLRFALQSVHADVRREVLTETMARSGAAGQSGEAWGWGLLLEFFNDPDPKLREEAFEFATKNTKEIVPLEAALRSRYADLRRRAVESLIKKHSKAAQALLAAALPDDDKDVRLKALDALIGDDVRDALRGALASPHDDVHARAAKALARHGDPAALRPLIELATAWEPDAADRKAEWAKLVETALDGLARLGDPTAIEHLLPLLASPHAGVRKGAGQALAWTALGTHPGSLRQAMQHDDPQVKYQAALGLALGGEVSAAPLVFSAEAAKIVSVKDRLAAALALGSAGEDQLVAHLDHADERARTHALLLLMLLELKSDTGVPSRCLACLAAREPRVRLRAARGLDSFRDPGMFLQFVTRLFTERSPPGTKSAGDENPWDIQAETVEAVAELVAFGPPAAKARTARLLARLFENEQAAWDRTWGVHEARFAREIASLQSQAAKRKPTPARYTPEQIEELTFGAYVGLVREQGGSYSAKDRAGIEPHVVRVRETAIGWVVELAGRNARFVKPAQSVLVQALGDPNQPVRTLAFEQLRKLGMDPTALGAEALETGHTDLGVRGLELLSGASDGRGPAKGQAVLEGAMLTRADGLAVEAAKLLVSRRGQAAVAAAALAAVHEPLRQQAVAWLAEEYGKSPDAAGQLRAALDSRYAHVREAAALELATKKDPAAYDALVRLLADATDEARQRKYVDALQRLGDSRTPAALLDRLENDPAKTATASLLLAAAGTFRDSKLVDRLLGYMDSSPAWRPPAANAVLAISGHQQPIDDVEDERPDREWERKQFPRHDAVLAALLEKSLTLNDAQRMAKLLPAARWSRGRDVDPILARFASHPDEKLRRDAVEALGWRVRKRNAAPAPLLAALSHRDPVTQFLAAEGLARVGRDEGLSALLSAVDFMAEVRFRERAVRAMGELGDARAFDTLLRLANEPGHVLQQEAAEAIGHLGKSAQADEVFKLLQKLSKESGPMAANAVRGLRWLDTPAAWQIIRQRAEADGYYDREVAAEMLGYNDDPATRDALLRLVAAEVNGDVTWAAFVAARRLFGADSLEPDYAWVRSPNAADAEDAGAEGANPLRRVGDEGSAARIFEVLPFCRPDVQDALARALLARPAPRAKEAEAALASAGARTARLAAQIIGRAGKAPKEVAAALGPALRRWQNLWEATREKVANDYEADEALDGQLTPTLRTFAWAAGRLNVADEELVSIVTAGGADARFRPVRLEAVSALASIVAAGKGAAPALIALEAAAVGEDPQARAVAAAALARHAPDRANQIADRLLPDRLSFNQIAAGNPAKAARKADNFVKTLNSAAASPHYQGIALPHLIARGQIDALSAVAADRTLPQATRLGAVEALGKLATPPAEERLRAVGAADGEDEDLRKAAWRTLRRSTRARRKSANAPAAEVKA